MQSFRVVIGMYNNLPYNASNALYEQEYQGAWRPFLSGLYKFLSIKSIIHFSGAIFSWLEKNHPEYMYLLTEMVRRGQIELLGGGFYNPIASLISTQDMTGQIEALSAFIRKTFGKRPSGAWLYEYAWTASLPAILQNSKIQYTFLPAQYCMCLYPKDIPCFPFASEDHRKIISLFPAFESRASAGIFEPYEKTLLKLQQAYPQCNTYVIMADGHEIAGSWEESGLESPDVLFERTFAWFQKNCLEYDTVTAAQLNKTLKSTSTVYFSQCYSERYKDYCQGTIKQVAMNNPEYIQISKQSVLDHPLVYALYQKLNFVSTMTGLFRGDKSRKRASLDDIWRAQSGDLYWIGPSGGILLPEARLAAYASLIEAEKTIRQNRFHHYLSFDDLNFDGVKEALFRSSVYTCYLRSGTASVSEFDSLKTGINYACGWNAVQCSTGCFRDSIKEEGGFEKELFAESEGWNLIENAKETMIVAFSHDFIGKIHNQSISLACRKNYRFENDFFSIDYELVNKSSNALSFRFCTESDIIAMPTLEEHGIKVFKHRQKQSLDVHTVFSIDSIDGFELSESHGTEKLLIRADMPFSLMGSPNLLQKPSKHQSNSSKDPSESVIFEGFSMKLGWDFALPAEGTTFFSLSIHLEY
ncbi:putative 4-alpha-glucanotransferase [uncultured spirochete]|jgi:hypothetical protein|uniref:Putative 4-alpha-glucanotransferase n=1 Tax=uncultured spirochete TaxID=156406 RepID=A0A3P3XU92_9SPIR|nr:putative 4-alpha-glucanotransferase [uncultured spirochete]